MINGSIVAGITECMNEHKKKCMRLFMEMNCKIDVIGMNPWWNMIDWTHAIENVCF